MDKVEAWERDLEFRKDQEALRHLEDSEGWSKLLDRLEALLIRKEKVKANLIRTLKVDEVIYSQGFIDGINFVMGEPNRVLSAANPLSDEEPETD